MGAAINICYCRDKDERDLVKVSSMSHLFSFSPINYMRETSQEYKMISLG